MLINISIFKNKSKKIFLSNLIILLIIISVGLESEVLKQRINLKKIILKNDEDNYFRFIPPSMAIDSEGNFYFPLNLKHKILKLNSEGKLIKTIGRKGQGPGDVYLPYRVKIYKNRLFVLDNNAFSIFTLDGKFINRFRYFAGIDDFVFIDDKIYADYTIGKTIIKVFDFKGKKLFSFADLIKINNMDYKKYKGVIKPKNFEDLTISKITSSSKHIYLMFPQFGVLCKYDKRGNFIKKRKLIFNDEHFDKNLEKIRNILINGKYRSLRIGYGLKNNKGIDIFLLSSINYCHNKLFISISSNFTKTNEAVVFLLNPEDLKVEKEYIFYAKDSYVDDRPYIIYKNGFYRFYMFLHNYETDLISIGLFDVK